ncbi:hypothetical protein BS78_08G096800 [Paspalum vaginatum]|nr:hypothetical protein BS78_08G096800 [Paspalum vaginatum]
MELIDDTLNSNYIFPFRFLSCSICTMVKSKASWSQVVKNTRPANLSIKARNLQPQDLGAVIFGCTNNTIAECHSRQLFGLPKTLLSYVRNIKEGLPLFLFNYDDRRLYGIYEAAGSGKFCPESNAWPHDGKGKTSYPAQVAMRIRVWCIPLAENQFRNAIVANYYQNIPHQFPGQKLHYFMFELDHAQTRVLIDMCTPSPPPNSFWMPPAAAPADDHVRELALSPGWAPECEGNNDLKSEKVVKSYADIVKKKTLEEVGTGDVKEHESSGKEYSNGFDDLDYMAVKVQQHQYPQEQGKVLAFNWILQGHKNLPGQQWYSDFYANATDAEDNNVYSYMYAQEVKCPILDGHSGLPETLDTEVEKLSRGHSDLLLQLLDSETCTEAKLIEAVKGLCGRIEVMEKKQAWSNKEVKYIQGVNEMLLKRIFVEQCLGSEDVIYLVGGFDGFSFLPTLDSFSPSLDILTPLKPMGVGKSYASTVALDGKIFVLGGGDGACWFDTVYVLIVRDDWITCPPLTHDKGSLAGVNVNGRIYAFGGGDGSECFSDVEIFDPAHGKWIKNQPMLEKRFALAGGALNGVIYAVGGFNGIQYLSSAERLDPQERNWKMLPMMSAERGCHTLAVLGEKILSIGGYDTGAKAMVATVEVYEPRMPSWVMVEPMNYTRGYHSSAVLGDSIFTFGGVKGEADTILDVVERCKEGCGWVTTDLKAIGRRCYCSAIVL